MRTTGTPAYHAVQTPKVNSRAAGQPWWLYSTALAYFASCAESSRRADPAAHNNTHLQILLLAQLQDYFAESSSLSACHNTDPKCREGRLLSNESARVVSAQVNSICSNDTENTVIGVGFACIRVRVPVPEGPTSHAM